MKNKKYKFYFDDGRTQNFIGNNDRIEYIKHQLNPIKIEEIKPKKLSKKDKEIIGKLK